jgi:hypothetical protein
LYLFTQRRYDFQFFPSRLSELLDKETQAFLVKQQSYSAHHYRKNKRKRVPKKKRVLSKRNQPKRQQKIVISGFQIQFTNKLQI